MSGRGAHHALLRHRRLDLAADHLGEGGAVGDLGGPEPPLGLGPTGPRGQGGGRQGGGRGRGQPGGLAPCLVHVHVQAVALSGGALLGREREREVVGLSNSIGCNHHHLLQFNS